MGRPLRVDGIGVWHNVSHRAAAQRLAFRDDVDKRLMWRLFGCLDRRFGVEVHALILLDTHLHAVVRSRDGRLSEAAQWLFSVYTKAFNVRHGLDGALFRGRFWSEPIRDLDQLCHTIRYAHENALDVARVTDPISYRWSTCAAHAGVGRGPGWLPRLGVAYALRHDTRLAKSTRKRPSAAVAAGPPRVPRSLVERAVAIFESSDEPFISLDFRTGLFRARAPG